MKLHTMIFLTAIANLFICIGVYQQNTEIHTLKWRVTNLEAALRN